MNGINEIGIVITSFRNLIFWILKLQELSDWENYEVEGIFGGIRFFGPI